MPRYNPRSQKITALAGTTKASVVTMTSSHSLGISRLKRSQNATHHTTTDATTSCAKASRVRELRYCMQLALEDENDPKVGRNRDQQQRRLGGGGEGGTQRRQSAATDHQ